MIVIVQSLDVSVAGEKEQGNFEQTRKRYEFFAKFDDVALLTQDTENFSHAYTNVAHVPCAVSRSGHIKRILSQVKPLRWLYFYVHSFFWLMKNHRRIDLLISDNIDSPGPLAVSILFSVPYVIYYRYDVGFQVRDINRRRILGSFVLALERFAFKRVKGLWVTSPHLTYLARKFGRRDRIKVIPNWFDTIEIELNSSGMISKESPIGSRVLFVGRLHPVKRVDLLLQAFRILHESDSSTHLYIIGEGEERQKITSLTNDLGLSERVHFLGYVDRRTIFSMMRQSDVLVLPSRIEGNPRVLIEAMICKIPIVATNVPGIREIVQHMKTGYLIDNANPDELASAIEYVLKNKEISVNMATRAYTFAKENFSEESVTQKIVDELEMLVPKYKAKAALERAHVRALRAA